MFSEYSGMSRRHLMSFTKIKRNISMARINNKKKTGFPDINKLCDIKHERPKRLIML